MGTLADSFNEMLDGLAEREKLRAAFGSYVDPDIAERVLAEGELLEGQEVEVTAMFVDVRDFTPFAERSSARETVAFLNDFFALVVPIVLEHGGHANKFIGDAVLACFGAPGAAARPRRCARLAAACEIAHAVDEHFGGDVGIGIGLNSGPVVVGSVGGGGPARLHRDRRPGQRRGAGRGRRPARPATRCCSPRPRAACSSARDAFTLGARGALELKGKSDRVLLHAPGRRGRSFDAVRRAAHGRRLAADKSRVSLRRLLVLAPVAVITVMGLALPAAAPAKQDKGQGHGKPAKVSMAAKPAKPAKPAKAAKAAKAGEAPKAGKKGQSAGAVKGKGVASPAPQPTPSTPRAPVTQPGATPPAASTPAKRRTAARRRARARRPPSTAGGGPASRRAHRPARRAPTTAVPARPAAGPVTQPGRSGSRASSQPTRLPPRSPGRCATSSRSYRAR